MSKPWQNSEGYSDPTAFEALQKVIKEESELDKKVNFVIKILKFIIYESGFELISRIEIRDTKTGRVFK